MLYVLDVCVYESSKEAEDFFRDYCASKKVAPNQAELDRLFNLFDKKGTGKISWEELCKPSLPGLARHTSTEKKQFQQRQSGVNLNTNRSSTQSSQNTEVKHSQLDEIFTSYVSEPEEPDNLFDEGLENFVNEFCSPETTDEIKGLYSLFIAYKCHAETTGQITRAEFKTGFSNLNCKNLEEVKTTIETDLQRHLKSTKLYGSFYKWTFEFLLDSKHIQ